MKVLHISDLHLGAKNLKLTPEKQSFLKSENSILVENLFEKAKEDVDVILICGDLFHSKSVSSKIKESFFKAVENFSKPVVYIKGNHDENFNFLNVPSNFIILDNTNPTLNIDNVVFWGMVDQSIYEKKFNETKTNILLLHGNIENHSDNDFVDVEKFLHYPFDYVAMGHIHQYKVLNIIGRFYVYCGSLFSNGFDECGPKGYVELIIDGKNCIHKFVPYSKRCYRICECNITEINNYNQLINKINQELIIGHFSKDDLIKVVLTGYFEENFEKNIDLIVNEFNDYFYFEIEDKSKLKIDLEKLKNEKLSFKAEFIEIVESQNDLDDQDKNKICQLGIEALKGDDLSI